MGGALVVVGLAHLGAWLLLGPLAVADTSEVAWVSTQRWRGVAAHFAQGAPDNQLFQLMGMVVVVIAAVILVMTALAFRAMSAAPSMALAIRAGLGTCSSPRRSAAG